MKKIGTAIIFTAAMALGACASTNSPSGDTAVTPAGPQSGGTGAAYAGYGVIQYIDVVKAGAGGIGGSGIGIGTIAGAVIGGVVGNQVGGGRGNTAATVIGAAGGAYAGHEIEKRGQQTSDAYKMTVRMDNGNLQTVTQPIVAELRVGDRVQIDNSGTVRRY
jgi:outer membrane lipoprotein SlyB